jgi:isoamylase
VFLNGQGITEPGLRGEDIEDDTFLILLNPGHEDAMMTLADPAYGKRWDVMLDTGADPAPDRRGRGGRTGQRRKVNARSIVVLKHG